MNYCLNNLTTCLQLNRVGYLLAAIMMAVILTIMGGCSTVGKDISDVDVEGAEQVEAECDRLGVTRECNAKLYADTITGMTNELVKQYEAGHVEQEIYDIQVAALDDALDFTKAYLAGDDDKDGEIGDILISVANFLGKGGGVLDSIVGIFTQ